MIITPCISSKLIINTISEEEQISDLVVVESVGGGEFSSENVMGELVSSNLKVKHCYLN